MDLVGCDFVLLTRDFFCAVPHEGYQNPCLLTSFCGLKPQMLQNTVFAVLYILRDFCSKKREAHQRPISFCQANCNPTLLSWLSGFATQHSTQRSRFCNPALLLGLRVLQPKTPLRGLRCCNPTLLLGLRVLQPTTPFKGLRFCKPTFPSGQVFAVQHSFSWAFRFCNPTLLLRG